MNIGERGEKDDGGKDVDREDLEEKQRNVVTIEVLYDNDAWRSAEHVAESIAQLRLRTGSCDDARTTTLIVDGIV